MKREIARTILILIVICAAPVAHSRIGADAATCESRYGRPTSADGETSYYQKGGYHIAITYSEGKATSLSCRSRNRISDQHLVSLIHALSGAEDWPIRAAAGESFGKFQFSAIKRSELPASARDQVSEKKARGPIDPFAPAVVGKSEEKLPVDILGKPKSEGGGPIDPFGPTEEEATLVYSTSISNTAETVTATLETVWERLTDIEGRPKGEPYVKRQTLNLQSKEKELDEPGERLHVEVQQALNRGLLVYIPAQKRTGFVEMAESIKDVVDDDELLLQVVRDGSYSYTSVQNVSRKIAKYKVIRRIR